MSEHYNDKKQLFCLIYNALLRSRQISSDWHRYAYSYCFSACVVNSLYEAYTARKVEGFADKYLQMLKNGGVENYRDALARFGIDASDADFWMTGMSLVSRYVDELERLYGEIFPDTKS